MAMPVLDSIGIWIALGLSALIFAALFRYHVLLALISKASSRLMIQDRPLKTYPRFTLLVPAHNEEMGIAATLGSIHALDYPKTAYRVIVIADNCTDLTAKTARACGGEVWERFDDLHKSKGYALEYAIQKLALETLAPDAIVVIDADTRVDRKLLQVFAQRLQLGEEWLQAYYSVSNPDDSWRTQLMTYAFGLFNGIWLAGQDALGLGCSLRGNGMAFAWAALARQPWRAYGLAEDLEFSWHLRTAGERVRFVPEARVYGEIISGNEKASKAQRLRWEKGRAELKANFGRAISGMPDRKLRKWLLRSDLNMPPLSRWMVLTFISSGAAVTALVLSLLHHNPGALSASVCLIVLNTIALAFFAYYLSLPFRKLGLPLRYLGSLSKAPLYIAWKFMLLLSRTPAQWVRTERMNKGK